MRMARAGIGLVAVGAGWLLARTVLGRREPPTEDAPRPPTGMATKPGPQDLIGRASGLGVDEDVSRRPH